MHHLNINFDMLINLFKAINIRQYLSPFSAFSIKHTKMEVENNLDVKIIDSVASNMAVFKTFGLWRPDNLNNIQKIGYYIYSVIIVTFFFYLYTLSYMTDVAMSFGDLEKFSKGSFLLLTLLAEIAKAFPIQTKQAKLQDLLDRMDGEIFKPKIQKHYDIITKYISLIKVMFKIFMCMYEGTVTLWALFPLFDRSTKMRLPLSGWYPFSSENSPAFELTYLYQIVGCVYLACLNCSLDIFISGMMVNIIAQLDILLDKLENGDGEGKENNDEEIFDGVEHMMFLKDCAIHHESIIR